MDDLLTRLGSALSDRYFVEEAIGRGGMATVFAAEDLRHPRKVAIKVLHPELAATIGAERFLREIRIAARLQHPHILPLFDSGSADGLLYYVAPLVRGESLRSRLDRTNRLPIDEAIRIAREIGEALDHAHRAEIVHRDIKPGNVLLTEDGRVQVADFGIAVAITDAPTGRLTRTGLTIGSPRYMSPEQATGDHEVGPRSDLYSLACLTYEMLCGHPPFDGDSTRVLIARHATQRPEPVRRGRPEVPRMLDMAVLTALAKRPEDRQATVREFLDQASRSRTIRDAVTLLRQQAAERRVVKKLVAWIAVVLVVPALAAFVTGWLILSPAIPSLVFAFLLLLTPSALGVMVVGRNGLPRLLPLAAANLLLGILVLVWLFQGVSLGPLLEARLVEDEEGNLQEIQVPRPEFRRTVALGMFRNLGSADLDWLGFGLPVAVESDLRQDLFLRTRIRFGEDLRAAGVDPLSPAPLPLLTRIALNRNLDWVLTGTIRGEPGNLDVTYVLYEASTGRAEAEVRVRGSDVFAITDEASPRIRRKLGIPSGYMRQNPDLSVSEVTTSDTAAFRSYVEGRRARDLAGDHAGQVSLFEAAVSRDSTFALAWSALFGAYVSNNRIDDARIAAGKARQHDYRVPEWSRMSMLQGYWTVVENDHEKAARVARKQVSVFPEDVDARLGLADIYQLRGSLDSSIAQLDTVLQFDVENGSALLRLADIYRTVGEHERSLEFLHRYKATVADQIWLEVRIAEALLAAGDLDAARSAFEQAVLNSPESHAAHASLAGFRAREGDLDGAISSFRDAIARSELAAERLEVLGRAVPFFLHLGLLDEAESMTRSVWAASEAAQHLLQQTITKLRTASWLAAAGNAGDGMALLDSLAPRIQDPLAAYREEAFVRFYRETGDVEGLRRHLSRLDSAAAATAPATWRALSEAAHGDLARWTGAWSEAAARYAVALTASAPDPSHMWTAIGACRRELGSFEDAASALDSALRIWPSDPRAHLEYGRLELVRARPVEARRHLEQASAAWSGASPYFEPAREARRLLGSL